MSSEVVQSTLIADWIARSNCSSIAGDKADVSSPQTAYPVFCASIDADAARWMALIVHRKEVGPGVDRGGSSRNPWAKKAALRCSKCLNHMGADALE